MLFWLHFYLSSILSKARLLLPLINQALKIGFLVFVFNTRGAFIIHWIIIVYNRDLGFVVQNRFWYTCSNGIL